MIISLWNLGIVLKKLFVRDIFRKWKRRAIHPLQVQIENFGLFLFKMYTTLFCLFPVVAQRAFKEWRGGTQCFFMYVVGDGVNISDANLDQVSSQAARALVKSTPGQLGL